MKKTKFMVGALVLSMGLLGTGYAYWTDALTVGTTVSTGKFDVTFDKGVLFGEGALASEHASSKITVDAEKIDLEMANIYPGAEAKFNYTMTNNSTIPMAGTVTVTASQEIPGATVKLYDVDTDLSYTGEGATLSAQLESVFKQAYERITPEQKDFKDVVVEIEFPGENEMKQGLENVTATVKIDWTQENAK
ncbi:MAG: hypothetical protein ACRCTE_04555 [Cellulosilyticaceae bacterium]